MSTKVIEYAASRLPSIATRTDPMVSYLKDTIVGSPTPGSANGLARCIMRFYNDRTRLAQLAQGIEKFNPRYNWKKLSAEHFALVGRLNTQKIPRWL